MSAHETNTDTEFETRILTQEEVHEQIKSYIAALTRQLEELIRLIHARSTADPPYFLQMADTSTNSCAACPSPDKTHCHNRLLVSKRPKPEKQNHTQTQRKT